MRFSRGDPGSSMKPRRPSIARPRTSLVAGRPWRRPDRAACRNRAHCRNQAPREHGHETPRLRRRDTVRHSALRSNPGGWMTEATAPPRYVRAEFPAPAPAGGGATRAKSVEHVALVTLDRPDVLNA